jgi:hypothetical protein
MRSFLLTFLLITGSLFLNAQSQEDFTNKVNDIYMNAGDTSKARTIARKLYRTVEQVKVLQTYSNYYLLKVIFETTAPDRGLAKTCEQKAEKLMNAMIGTVKPTPLDSTDSTNVWYMGIFQLSGPLPTILLLAMHLKGSVNTGKLKKIMNKRCAGKETKKKSTIPICIIPISSPAWVNT